MERLNHLNWLIGGPQGSGVDSAATMFAKACAFGGLHVYGQREYYSNIMGEHSYYQIRVADRPLSAAYSKTDLLVTFDAETVFTHALDITPQGGLIYDPKHTEISLERLPTMEPRAREDLKTLLAEQGLGDTLEDLISVLSKRGVRLYPVPYDELIEKLSQETGQPISQLKRTINTMAVAASCALLGYGLEWLKRALSDVFKGKEKVIELNAQAGQIVYEYIEKTFGDGFSYGLRPIETGERRIYLTGNQAVALGKLVGGCSFQTYYPISPATDESVYLEAHQIFALKERAEAKSKEGSVLVIQTEDEIAAITSATGAALAGARASTSTSGPGFSLMVEGLGWAGINEVPVVVTLYQRGSPSTGLPTRSEQGDLRFVLHAGHGEFPRIVIASGDLEEAFYDAVRAFNWAEAYQLPVIHLLDKAIASSSQTRPPFDLNALKLSRGRLLGEEELQQISENGVYRRFQFTETGVSPRATLGQKGGIFWLTGDEHDEWGHITEDPVVRTQMMEKRMRKLETAASEIPLEEKLNVFGEGETVIISWGSPKGALLEAMERLREDGLGVKFVQVRLLCPLPAEALSQHLTSAKLKIAVENNFSGQLMGLVREQTGIAMDHLIVKYNGRPMLVDELYDALKVLITRPQKVPRKVVLTHGA